MGQIISKSEKEDILKECIKNCINKSIIKYDYDKCKDICTNYNFLYDKFWFNEDKI